MKKIVLLLSGLMLVATYSFSQKFINGVGICVFSTGGSGFNSFITGGITYSPRFNISESDNSAISIGLPLSIGISYSGSTSGDNASASAMVNIPLVVNYNFGAGAVRGQSDSKFGFFAGGGFGYHIAAYANSDDNYSGNNGDGSSSINSYGPVGNAGIRIGVGSGSHNIELKASYMKGLDVSKADIFGVAGIFNF